ncbi:MAG TPA: class I lanthipeptide [Thermoanaerobaculia bacterium]|jgi:hypothetical protein|nr:class I lanthipeptide [Thermoanaerobaculia bacterium]
MKKNRLKKLTLHRETLAELDRPELGLVAAASDQYTCPSFTCYPDICQYSRGRATCTTCNLTCNTNYC